MQEDEKQEQIAAKPALSGPAYAEDNARYLR